jgi:hypothetical protein
LSDVDDRGERQRRLDRARRLAETELTVAIGAPLFVGFLLVAAPGNVGPMFDRPPLLGSLIPWLGFIGIIVGIVWMIRIYRADPEPVQPTWRYRDF